MNVEYEIVRTEEPYTPTIEEVLEKFDVCSLEQQREILTAAMAWVIWYFTGETVMPSQLADTIANPE